MKIVILDGAVVNPGDLSWEALEEMGRLTVYDRTPPEEVVGRAKDAEIVLTNKVYFTGELMEQCPRLKYIGALATGYNNIDVAAAARLGIAVTNVPAYSTHAVAQFTMALLLELCHRVGRHAGGVGEVVGALHIRGHQHDIRPRFPLNPPDNPLEGFVEIPVVPQLRPPVERPVDDGQVGVVGDDVPGEPRLHPQHVVPGNPGV